MPSTAPLEIFRAGRHVAMSGESIAFSDDDIAASVAAYDPDLHEAPLVVGHPKHDLPAYGVVRSLSVSGSSIEATPDHVDPAFAEMVNAKRFSKISASFYAPDSPSNPVPGVYYLRHVGFLGAQPPAVKGLRTPSFADGETGVVEFSEWDDINVASLLRSLRDWMLSKFGSADADKALPGYLIQSVEQNAQLEAIASTTDTTTPAFAEDTPTMTADQISALQAENARLKADADALRRSQAELRRTALHTENVAFAEQLGSEGRLAAAHQPVIVAALDALASGDTPIEFGEGEAKKPLATAVREVLTKLPQSVEFGEVATPKRAAGTTGTVSFAAPDGATVDQGSLAIHGKVIAYQSRHKVTYEAALDAVLGGAA
ncbi:peptidase [uncultured Sphaerotilus sp.]|uniref:peptidase n=1 Tax=uncultured Sphaerotilus sp. TaxID=474984 RepID=UPI0030CA2F7B